MIQTEYNINGKIYKLVEEPKPKERDRIEAWANVEPDGSANLWGNKHSAYYFNTNSLECVRLVELREDERVVSKDCANNAYLNCSGKKSFLEMIGFDEEVNK